MSEPLNAANCIFPDYGNEIWDKMDYNSVTVVIGLATVRKNLKRNIFVTDHQ